MNFQDLLKDNIPLMKYREEYLNFKNIKYLLNTSELTNNDFLSDGIYRIEQILILKKITSLLNLKNYNNAYYYDKNINIINTLYNKIIPLLKCVKNNQAYIDFIFMYEKQKIQELINKVDQTTMPIQNAKKLMASFIKNTIYDKENKTLYLTNRNISDFLNHDLTDITKAIEKLEKKLTTDDVEQSSIVSGIFITNLFLMIKTIKYISNYEIASNPQLFQ